MVKRNIIKTLKFVANFGDIPAHCQMSNNYVVWAGRLGSGGLAEFNAFSGLLRNAEQDFEIPRFSADCVYTRNTILIYCIESNKKQNYLSQFVERSEQRIKKIDYVIIIYKLLIIRARFAPQIVIIHLV